VCIPPGRNDAPENAGLLDLLSSALPVKVLVQTDDLLEEASIGTGHFAFGVRSARLATTAMGLGGMFVLQSPSSNLYALRERVAPACARAARRCSASTPAPPRASWCRVPGGRGGDGVARLSRPSPTTPPPARTGPAAFRSRTIRRPRPTGRGASLQYADEALQRVVEPTHFTYADFVLCDRRYAATSRSCRASAGHAAWCRWPTGWRSTPSRPPTACPYVWAADANDMLHRVLVDARLMQATRRCLLLWHRLQEHGGINDSHAQRCCWHAQKAAWETQMRLDAEAGAAAVARRGSAAAAAEATAPPPRRTAAARRRGEAAVRRALDRDLALPELRRVPELINDRMFAYNENKQAYIKDDSTPAPTASWSRRPKPARWRSSTRASRATRRSPGSTSCWSAPSRSSGPGLRLRLHVPHAGRGLRAAAGDRLQLHDMHSPKAKRAGA
jgi:hypothetical protein